MVAPDIKQIENDLFLKCPGLSPDTEIDGVPRPGISFKGCGESCQTRELLNILTECYQEENASCYFAVDVGSDEENMFLAIRLREALIRSIICANSRRLSKAEKKKLLTHLPAIAFRCRDQLTAHLSESMVSELENFGDQWFNSPGLIPFGSSGERYTWSNVTGGVFEKFSKTIHLQYSLISQKTVKLKEKYIESRDEVAWTKGELDSIEEDAMTEYFRRAYNHASSLSVAMSLPYRLFQIETRIASGSDVPRLIPPCWKIVDSNAYCSEVQLKALQTRLNELHSSISQEQWSAEMGQLAQWEHDRWARWMLSRGWLPETIPESVSCIDFGNRRQQLFIARLHPCICPYSKLSELSEALEEKNMKKDFVSLDRESMEMTADTLEFRWYGKQYDKEMER